jgi:hypothetical protein
MDGLILPCREYWPAAILDGASAIQALDLPAADAATPAAIAGSNQAYAALTFPDAVLTYARRHVGLPEDLYPAGGLSLRLFWTTPAIVGSVRWSAETAYVAEDDDLDPVFNPVGEVVTPAPAVADVLATSTLDLDLTNLAAGALLLLRIGRDATDSDDDLVDDVNLIGVEFVYQRRIVLPQ